MDHYPLFNEIPRIAYMKNILKKKEYSREAIRFRLRTKFILGIVILECLLIAAVTFLVEYQMRDSILDQFLKRGFFVARNLALLNTGYLSTYNYVNIQQSVDRIAQEDGLTYVAVLIFNGEVAAFRGPVESDKSVLSDTAVKWILRGDTDRYRYRSLGDDEICEISVPVFLEKENWGKVAVGVSIKALNGRIAQTRVEIWTMGLLALFVGCLGSVFLARRITHPIHALVRNVDAITERRYEEPITIDTGDEIGYLAQRFAAMQTMLKEHLQKLGDANAGLQESNDQLQHEIQERMKTEAALEQHRQALEEAVEHRTAELKSTNEKLRLEISERQKAESESRIAREQAEAANQAKSRFLASMSHEIRNPMSGFLGAAEFLSKTRLDARQNELVDMICASGETLLAIVNDILDISKIEAGKLELEVADFDLYDLVEDATRMAFPGAYRKNLELSCLIHRDVIPAVRGDSVRIRQILNNLVGNAIKFTPSGEILIEVSLMQDIGGMILVRVDVTDTGIGMTPEQKDRIFASFSQADISTTRKYGGTGLGLSICKQFVEKMDGAIGVESQPGKGSVFWFTMYLGKQSDGERPAAAPDRALQGKRVLAVDGSANRQRILKHYLSDVGIECESAGEPEAAVQLMRHAMEKGNGYDAVLLSREIHERMGRRSSDIFGPSAPAAPVIILTPERGFEGSGDEGPGGPLCFLNRPISRSGLYACLAAPNQAPADGSTAVACQDQSDLLWEEFHHRILLAEDDLFNQNFYQLLLQQYGCEVDAVASGEAAVHAHGQKKYDLILMDCEMPGMNGYDATKKIRQHERTALNSDGTAAGRSPRHKSRIPIIAITGHAFKEARQKCLDVGMDDYLCKPFTIDQLSEKLGKWLRAGDKTPQSAPGGITENYRELTTESKKDSVQLSSII